MEINVDASTSTNENFYSIEVGHNFVPRVSLLPLRRQRREGREALGTRLIRPDIRLTCACATFCFHLHYFDESKGAGIKRSLSLALCLRWLVFITCAVLGTLMLTFRAWVASENKVGFYASTHTRPALLKVRASCCSCASGCVADETGLFTRL